MCPVIIWDDDVEPFEIEGETFQLKRKLTHGDRQTLSNYYVTQAAKLNGEDVPVDAGKPMLLLLAIKGWSLKDRDGNPLEVNAENINRLDSDVTRSLLLEINERNPIRTDKGKNS
jgi:hypothetical protein